MSTLNPQEEAEKEDQRLLAENKRKIDEILELIKDRKDREGAKRDVEMASLEVVNHESGMVFHDHGGKKVAIHNHASKLMRLAEAIELEMKTQRHGKDLHKALVNLCRHRVKLLQRIQKRGLF